MKKTTEELVAEVLEIVKASNDLHCDASFMVKNLAKVVDKSGKKHLDLAKLVQLGESGNAEDAVAFAEVVVNSYIHFNEEDNTFNNNFTPACGWC